MEASQARRAVEAGRSTAAALGLEVDDVAVLHNPDRIAQRLMPCDVLARVAPSAHQADSEFEVEFEVEAGRRLAGTDVPVGECRILNWALFTAWRWRRDDQMPGRPHWRMEGLSTVRAALDRYGPGRA
jgi:hypothetical protein